MQTRDDRTDLKQDWARLVVGSGFAANERSMWIIEGLFYYLEAADVHHVLKQASHLAASGSVLVTDLVRDPKSYVAINATPTMLIKFAYSVQSEDQISGAQSWLNTARYDIHATIEDSQVDNLKKLARDQGKALVQLMVQSFLIDRFQIKVSYTRKQLPYYALVVARGGPKLLPPSDPTKSRGIGVSKGELRGN